MHTAASFSVIRIVRRNKNGTAEAEQRGNDIIIYDRFFDLPSSGKSHSLLHELGHWFRDFNVPIESIVGWEKGEGFFINIQGSYTNFEEGFAEAFATYIDDPSWLKSNYPVQFDKLKELVGVSFVSKAKNWVKQVTKSL